MTAVVSWGGDSIPDGVLLGSPSESSYFLTAATARTLTDEIRHHLGSAIARLAEARAGHAHLALGYASWWQYCEAEFGDLREMRLPKAERQALHASMHDDGLSVSECQAKTGFSRGTVHGDWRDTGRAPAKSADVIPLHEPEANPYAGMSRMRETLARVAAQQDRGLTSIELDAETGWPLGTATANLSKLHRRGLVAMSEHRRLNRGGYVVTDAGRTTLEEQQ